jgi:preprotein translocase subunit SecA
MAKKKTASSKGPRVKAATAANPVQPKDIAQPAKAPTAGTASPAAGPQDASNARMARSAPLASAGRPAFRRPQSLNFAGVGRNDICPCGSGKRFKNCHGH